MPMQRRKKARSHPQPNMQMKPETGSLMCSAIEEKAPEDMSEIAKTHMMEILGPVLPTRVFIRYWGKDAFRKGKPALIINHSEYNPHERNEDGVQVGCYVIKYKDGEVKWFPMSIQTYEFDKKPSWLFAPRRWAEMIPEGMIMEQYAVKGE